MDKKELWKYFLEWYKAVVLPWFLIMMVLVALVFILQKLFRK